MPAILLYAKRFAVSVTALLNAWQLPSTSPAGHSIMLAYLLRVLYGRNAQDQRSFALCSLPYCF